MAILATVTTVHGEDRELYIRLNNVEASNHGVKAYALFRGFLSEEAFDNDCHYMFEKQVEFDADVGGNLWDQAYTALKTEIEGVDA
ncbi:hypothetical protein OAP32_00530 [Crocinitomicaceae bacterium]|nr:hypothetical protein [Crocinitomicaceae bacterium]